jgi:hypothetical protein
MHEINSSSVRRRLVQGFVVSLLTVASSILTGVVPQSVSAETASAQTQAEDRIDIVSATRWQLVNPRPFKEHCTSSAPIYQSDPQPPNVNNLSRNGSNANCNIYNNYNGLEWCGYFARWAWTLGGQKSVAQLPESYPSSQAWMTDAGSRWRAYSSGGALPQLGDVLVWTNVGGGGGHVAVVTAVSASNRAITYIGGNEGGDRIVQHSDYWSNMDISMSGKTFRGFASRF